MNRSSELERQVIAALIMRPGLLEADERLAAAAFSTDINRRIFSAIVQAREDGQKTVDEVLLTQAAEISPTELSRITSGCYVPVPANFQLWISRLLLQRAGEQALRLSNAESAALVKSGEIDVIMARELEEAWRKVGEIAAGGGNGQVRFARRKCSEIEDEPIRYAWKDIIPFRMPMAITGYPGDGKTLVAVDASARISRGAVFPAYREGEEAQSVKGKVLYISSEGVPESILRPRLFAAGADLSQIDIIEGVLTKNKELAILDITRHLPDLRREVEKDPEIRLVVIDPIASFMPASINDRAQNQVRQAMDLISAFADKTGVAAVVCMHFNKDSSQRAVNRTSGSAQYMAAVKSSWSVVRQKGDPANRRLLVPQKSNIAATEKSLPFTIHPFKYDSPRGTIDTARIQYEAPVTVDAEDLISPQGQPAISMTARARAFLREQLQYGRKGARELHIAAEEQGIRKDTLWDAKRDLDILDERDGYQGKSFWRFPDKKGEE